MSDIFVLPDLIEALLLPPQGLQSDLSLGESMQKIGKRLEPHRGAVLSALSTDALIEEALPGVSSDRVAALNEIFDVVMQVMQAPATGQSLLSWFAVFQKVAATAQTNNVVGLMELGLWHSLQHLGEQRYMRAACALDALNASVNCYLLQNRLIGDGHALAERIVTDIKANSPALPNADRTWTAVQEALGHCLNHWGRLGPVHTTKFGVFFILGFLKHLVAAVELPAYHWERLLLCTERVVGELQPKSRRELSYSIEPLLACVPIFGLLGEWLRRIRQLIPAENQLGQLIALQVVFTQRPQAHLNQQWMQCVDVTALHRAGWSSATVQRMFAGLIEPLRALYERHELDPLMRCSARIGQWADAQMQADSLCEAGRPRFSAISASLVEGVADSDSRQRLARQIEALARACITHWSVSSDIRIARALLRKQVALHLDYSRDLAVWKRNKQLVAGFAQFETPAGVPLDAAQALHQLAPELELSISDQLRYPLRWLQTNGASEREIGSRPGEIKIMIVRWAAMCRVSGAMPAVIHMNHWFSSWLCAQPRAVSHPAMVRTLGGELESSALMPGCELLRSGLRQWLQQSQACSAGSNLRLSLDRVVDECISFGLARYEDRHKQSLVPDLSRGIKTTWDLGRLDCAWSLGKLITVLHSPSKNGTEDFLWWWQTGVGKNIASLPEGFVRAYLQALSDALHDTLSQEEASALYSPVFNCYQKTFGLRGTSEKADLLQFSPLPSRTPVWQKLLSGPDTAYPFAAHTRILSACCPDFIADWGTALVAVAGLHSDEEMLWQSQAPMMFGLMLRGSAPAEEALQAWQHAGAAALPPGAAALWMGWIERSRQMLQQIRLGHVLISQADEIVRHVQHICPEILDAFPLDSARGLSLGWVIRQSGIRLMSTPATACALDSTRLMLYVNAVQPTMKGADWRKLWLVTEAVVRLSVHTECDLALLRWIPQWIMAVEPAEKLNAVTSQLFGTEEMVFAETRGEELKWRDAISALLAACLAPDYAPIDGQSLVGRAVFSCDAFAGESPASWNERSQAILGMLRDSGLPDLAGTVAQRMAHVATLLHDRSRLLEMPSLNGFHRCCVLLRGVPGSVDPLQSRILARAVDQREASLLPEDAFLVSLLRKILPDLSQLTTVRTVLEQGLQYSAPAQLERKKFIGREMVPLNARQLWALNHVPRAMAAASILGSRFAERAACEAAIHFSAMGTDPQLGKLALWLATDAKRGFAETKSQELAQALLGDCVAGWRMHQARMTPPKGQSMGPTFLMKDVGRMYLVALLTHQIRRADAPQTLELLSNRLMVNDWNHAAPQLNQWVQMLAQAEQQVFSPLVNAWVQLAVGSRRLAA